LTTRRPFQSRTRYVARGGSVNGGTVLWIVLVLAPDDELQD